MAVLGFLVGFIAMAICVWRFATLLREIREETSDLHDAVREVGARIVREMERSSWRYRDAE